MVSECLGEVDGSDASDPKSPLLADEERVVVKRIRGLRHGRGVRPRRGLVDLCRSSHVERLVWSLGVEDFEKVVEGLLLLEQVGPSWTSRLELEGAVHSLVAAVFFGVPRTDPFVRY